MQSLHTRSRFFILRTAFALTAIVSILSLHACDESSAAETATVQADGGLRMRSAPNLEAERILTIPDDAQVEVIERKGETITVSGKSGQWTRVRYDSQTGWVFGGFLRSGAASEDASDVAQDPASASALAARIQKLTGVSIPAQAGASEREFAEESLADFALIKQQGRGNYLVFTIAPNGRECSHYGYSDCINIIADKNKTYITSDLFGESFGMPDDIKDEHIVFQVLLGEGDVCAAGGDGTNTAYVFAQKQFFTHKWSQSTECTCCEATAEGLPDCPCDQYKTSTTSKFLDERGRVLPDSPALQSIFGSYTLE